MFSEFIPTHPRAVSISMNYNQMVIHWTEPLENADKVNIYEISYQRSTDTEPKIARVVGFISLTLCKLSKF